MAGYNNQPKVVIDGGGSDRGDATGVEHVGGCCIFVLGGELKGNKNSKKK
jgi:hypothetical protein